MRGAPMKRVLGVLAAVVVSTGTALADIASVSIDGIAGGNPLSFQSITIGLDTFSILKNVDSVSPQIVTAISLGNPLGDASVRVYNGAPGGVPDAQLTLSTVLGESQVIDSASAIPTETDTFHAMTPDLMYLELPGIAGGTPLQIQSLTLDASGGFSVVRQVDAASPAIAHDASLGTLL
jgi:hypothetical protein